jgi:hypothetical protein
MPVKDIPAEPLDPAIAPMVNQSAQAFTKALDEALAAVEEGNPVVVIGTECLAAAMNLLAERMAERRTYFAPLTREMKHADMLNIIMADVMRIALDRYQ